MPNNGEVKMGGKKKARKPCKKSSSSGIICKQERDINANIN